MARHSYLRYFETDTSDGDAGHSVPSALLWDGSFLFVPLYAVTSMSLSETYHLPPLGSRAAQAMVASQEDTISLSGVLVGVERFAWKLALELAADAAVRGSALASYSQGAIGGLALVTSMTIRTDIYIQSLSFSSTAAKRNAIEIIDLTMDGNEEAIMADIDEVFNVRMDAIVSEMCPNTDL